LSKKGRFGDIPHHHLCGTPIILNILSLTTGVTGTSTITLTGLMGQVTNIHTMGTGKSIMTGSPSSRYGGDRDRLMKDLERFE
jgi:hypothetical protein